MAKELHQCTSNFFWLLHLYNRDANFFPQLGQNHSAFSRYGVMAGILCAVLTKWQDMDYQQAWDAQSPQLRHTRTAGYCYHMASLLAIMFQWSRKTMPDEQFYVKVNVEEPKNTFTEVTLLNPVVAGAQLLSTMLDDWWSTFVTHFAREKLPHDPLREGPFRFDTPPRVSIPPKSQRPVSHSPSDVRSGFAAVRSPAGPVPGRAPIAQGCLHHPASFARHHPETGNPTLGESPGSPLQLQVSYPPCV